MIIPFGQNMIARKKWYQSLVGDGRSTYLSVHGVSATLRPQWNLLLLLLRLLLQILPSARMVDSVGHQARNGLLRHIGWVVVRKPRHMIDGGRIKVIWEHARHDMGYSSFESATDVTDGGGNKKAGVGMVLSRPSRTQGARAYGGEFGTAEGGRGDNGCPPVYE
jgi:hypothetical protein